MAKLNQLARIQEQRVIVFGPPKVGKTELAGKLAEKYKILYFSLENGHSTLFKLPPEWQDRIEVINIRDSKAYPIAIETMLKVIKGDRVKICIAHSKVACPICTKSGAEVDEVCLNEVGPDTVVVVDSLTQLTLSALAHITKNQPDDYKCQLDDWGALKLLMEKFLSQVQVAKYNIVCISHEEEVKFEDGRTKIVPVGGSSNSSRNTAKYFDHVVYANVVNKKHVVGSATDYSTTVLTGSRTDVKLEANKEGGSLLDLFITWKLPNFGLDSSQQTAQAATQNATATSSNASAVVTPADNTAHLTPAQRALANLQNRNK